MQGCAIDLPFETPYDQDVVFEHLQSVARAHHRVALEISERCLLVSECGTRACGCAECGRTIACGSVQHHAADHTLCTRCARRMLQQLAGDAEAPSTPNAVTGAAAPPAPC